jgi:hypothetical protein
MTKVALVVAVLVLLVVAHLRQHLVVAQVLEELDYNLVFQEQPRTTLVVLAEQAMRVIQLPVVPVVVVVGSRAQHLIQQLQVE